MVMVAAMIGSFFFCWLPYATISMLVILVPDISITPLIASMPAHLAKTSPAYNPIIFFLAKKQVRKNLILNLITSKFSQNASQKLANDFNSFVGVRCLIVARSSIRDNLQSFHPVPGHGFGDYIMWFLHS